MSAMTSGADDGAHGELVPVGPPPSLRWNLWATAVWSGLTVLANVVLFGQRPYLHNSLIDQNAKAKKPIPAAKYLTEVDHDVHNLLISGLIRSLLVVVILMLLAVLTWRSRRLARWGLLAMATVPGVLLGVGVIGQLVGGAIVSAPGLYKFTLVAAGIASLLVVVLMLQGATREYFAALRDTQRGTLPAVPGSRPSRSRGPASRLGSLGSTGARPAGGGLGALFAPRRRPPAPSADGANPSANDLASPDPASPDPTSPDLSAAEGSSPTTASRRPTATRPGSVKAKGGSNRSGRFKSRQQ